MNFIRFEGRAAAGAEAVDIQGRAVAVPRLHEDAGPALALGVRPEHIRLDDAAELRGGVYAVEYLGTRQIVTVETPEGMLKARIGADQRAVVGERVGLALNSPRLSLFDTGSGRAIRSDLFAEAARG